MTSHAAGVQERLRKAELDRAGAEARAEEEAQRRTLADDLAREATARAEEEARGRDLAEQLAREAKRRAIAERRRRRMTVGLAGALLFMVIMGGGVWFANAQRRTQRRAGIKGALAKAEYLQRQATEAPVEDPSRWSEALAAVEQAEGLLEGANEPDLRQDSVTLREEITTGRIRAEKARSLLLRLVDIRSAKADDLHGMDTDEAYADAFREADLDLSILPPTEVGERIRARRADEAVMMAAALDDWASVRRNRRSDLPGANRCSEAARSADPDRWRNTLRAALTPPNVIDLLLPSVRMGSLHKLAASARPEDLPPASLVLLGAALLDHGDAATAEKVLRAAQRQYPADAWVNYELAQCLGKLSRRDEAIRFYTAARAIRPELAHQLAHALQERGDWDEAIAVFQDLVHRRNTDGRHLGCLAQALHSPGQVQGGREPARQGCVNPRSGTRAQTRRQARAVQPGLGAPRPGKAGASDYPVPRRDPDQPRLCFGPLQSWLGPL